MSSTNNRQNRPKTVAESAAESMANKDDGVRLTDVRLNFIYIVTIIQTVTILALISGFYDWVLRYPTVDNVFMTVSVIGGVSVIGFMRLLKG